MNWTALALNWGIFLISHISLIFSCESTPGDYPDDPGGGGYCLLDVSLTKKIWTWDKSASNVVLPVYEDVLAKQPLRHQTCDFWPKDWVCYAQWRKDSCLHPTSEITLRPVLLVFSTGNQHNSWWTIVDNVILILSQSDQRPLRWRRLLTGETAVFSIY